MLSSLLPDLLLLLCRPHAAHFPLFTWASCLLGLVLARKKMVIRTILFALLPIIAAAVTGVIEVSVTAGSHSF